MGLDFLRNHGGVRIIRGDRFAAMPTEQLREGWMKLLQERSRLVYDRHMTRQEIEATGIDGEIRAYRQALRQRAPANKETP